MNIEQPAQKHVLHNLPDGALKGEKEKRNNVTRVTKRVTKRKNVSWISLFFWLNHRFFSSHFQILYSELRRPHLWWHHPSGPSGIYEARHLSTLYMLSLWSRLILPGMHIIKSKLKRIWFGLLLLLLLENWALKTCLIVNFILV